MAAESQDDRVPADRSEFAFLQRPIPRCCGRAQKGPERGLRFQPAPLVSALASFPYARAQRVARVTTRTSRVVFLFVLCACPGGGFRLWF